MEGANEDVEADKEDDCGSDAENPVAAPIELERAGIMAISFCPSDLIITSC